MTTDTTTAAVTHLRAIREQWGDLCAAIDTPPPAEWPPRELHHTLHAIDPGTPTIGRLPLTLREHPAPLNLDALDAACAIERALFELADIIAAERQRPIRRRRTHHPDGGSSATTYRPTTRESRTDRNDPDRWHYATPTWPGSRALGLHWCAVWLERALSGHNPLCRPVGVDAGLLATETIAAAHRVMTRALGRDGRDTVLPAPCPWCAGELTARTTSGDPMAAVVTCGTGPTCTAPAPYDGEARRVWQGADLCGLYGAMSAAQRRATA